MTELVDRLDNLASRVEAIWRRLDLPAKIQEATALEQQSASPTLWDNPENARQIMQRLAALQEDITYWTHLRHEIQDTQEFYALGDEELYDELNRTTDKLEDELVRAEFRLLLSGPHDRADAILAIHAGAGGTDSQDWANMLLRMFLRWAERRGFKTEILDSMEGEGAGIKSVMVSIRGEFAYGYLRSERGVHRLVRLSPFDAAHRRHTSFALVEVWPDLGEDAPLEINPDDLQIDTYRASSAGGQHMQKNETAVRITHLPTGIVSSCQNERSQTQNREVAMRVLKARLMQLEEEKRRQQLSDLKGEHVDAGWGNQIRSYVIHPYQMVKDHRTDYETGNVQAVFDGELDAFMEAYLHLVD
ncbi:MAG TPA: peptide chain release factor 2 [Anaerolineae bacterium]|nr:peptide chain release factor 2 [Anaerolineae bacterium]HQI85432.1 peptide chain release factor 2 [Anaerolineae bacterium]